MMLQYSVYARYCSGQESDHAFRHRIREAVPAEGHVRLLSVTDRQFGKMDIIIGRTSHAPESPPDQIMLF